MYNQDLMLTYTRGREASTSISRRINSQIEGYPGGITSPWTSGILSQCVHFTKDQPYLEIGTRHGGSAILATLFTKEKVYAIDPMETLGDLWQTEMDTGHTEIFAANMRAFGVEDQVELLVGTSLDPHPELDGLRFGTVFIDGDHSYEWVMNDWKFVRGLVDTFVVFDDIVEDDVYRAFMTIAAQETGVWRIAFLNYTTGVLIRKQDWIGKWDTLLQIGPP